MTELFDGSEILTIYPVVFPGFIQIMAINKTQQFIAEVSLHIHIKSKKGRVATRPKPISLGPYESEIVTVAYEAEPGSAIITALFFKENVLVVQVEVFLEHNPNLLNVGTWEKIMDTLEECAKSDFPILAVKASLEKCCGAEFYALTSKNNGVLYCCTDPICVLSQASDGIEIHSDHGLDFAEDRDGWQPGIFFALGRYSVHLSDQLELNMPLPDVIRTIDRVEYLVEKAGLSTSLSEIKRILLKHENVSALSQEDRRHIDLRLHNLEMCIIKEV